MKVAKLSRFVRTSSALSPLPAARPSPRELKSQASTRPTQTATARVARCLRGYAGFMEWGIVLAALIGGSVGLLIPALQRRRRPGVGRRHNRVKLPTTIGLVLFAFGVAVFAAARGDLAVAVILVVIAALCLAQVREIKAGRNPWWTQAAIDPWEDPRAVHRDPDGARR